MAARNKSSQTSGPRRYVSQVRTEGAAETRAKILEAARHLFLAHGYAQTTMAGVADRAGVAVDTVYASVGRKPHLLRLLLETAISGTVEVVPAEERDYVRAIRAESDPGAKLDLYAAAVARLLPRLSPVVRVCVEAGPSEPEVARMWREVADRRAGNMRLLAEELAATGSLLVGLTVEEAADTLWATNSPELYDLLVGQRGWSVQQYQAWLARTWRSLLLRPAGD